MNKITESRGSILIWTLLLGLSLAVVFFFFAQRLGANVASQRETMEYQSKRMFFESYIAYIEGLGISDLDAIKGSINFQGVTGIITNEVDEITGVLDMGSEVSYEVENGDAKIEWNLCGENGVLKLTATEPAIFGNCKLPDPLVYDGVSQSTSSPFTLESLGEPLTYRISPQGDAVIYDNKWRLDLEMSLGFRKKLTASRIFTPSS